MKPVDSFQFLDWSRVVIHPEIPESIIQTPVSPTFSYYEQGGRLPSSLVTARLLARPQGLDHPFGQGSVCVLESLGHGLRNFRPSEQIPLYGIVRTRLSARPVHALLARVDGGVPVRGNHAQLAAFPYRVSFRHQADRFPWALPVFEQTQSDRSVPYVSPCLAGYGSDARLGIRHDAPDGDELGLNGYPQFPGSRVAGDDGKSGNRGRRGLSFDGKKEAWQYEKADES